MATTRPLSDRKIWRLEQGSSSNTVRSDLDRAELGKVSDGFCCVPKPRFIVLSSDDDDENEIAVLLMRAV